MLNTQDFTNRFQKITLKLSEAMGVHHKPVAQSQEHTATLS